MMRVGVVQFALALGLLTTSFDPMAATLDVASPLPAPLEWPLAAPRRITSGFGEYRAGHYHGGIDLSTERITGRPLAAAADGHVWRVRASGGGYGRAVDLRLVDGRTVVLAHLERFAPRIEAYVAAAQESLGRYEVDLHPPPERLRVARGEEIGWSGASGAGPPHLHFELREGPGAEIGINPLRHGFAVEDSTPPRIGRLIVDELATPEALRIRRGRRRDVALRATAPGRYLLSDTLRITGAAVLAVETFDPGVGGSRAAPWRAAVSLDGRLEYEVRFDAFDWNRAHEVELAWDPEEVAAGSTFVLRLFRPVGARDSRFQSAPDGAGVIGRRPGGGDGGLSVRRLEIEISDAGGNASRLTGIVRFAPVTTAWVPDHGEPRSGSDAAARDTLLVPGVPCRLRMGVATVTLADSSLFGPARWRLAHGATAAGRESLGVVDVTAPGAVLDHPMIVMLRPPAGRPSDRTALYHRGGGRWRWVGNKSSPDGIGGATRLLGRFALLDDTAPPVITIETPAGTVRPRLSARVTDDLSGVTWRTITVRIDSLEQIVVFDPESATLTGRSRRPLAPGRHTMTVHARDRAGNESVSERRFRTVSSAPSPH